MRAALGVLALSLCMVPLLRAGIRRLCSMAAPPCAPGTLSAAFVTCPNESVAKDIARALVEKHLAACVNIVPQVTSIYEWKGKIEEDGEVLLMIKTRSSRIPALTDFVRSVQCPLSASLPPGAWQEGEEAAGAEQSVSPWGGGAKRGVAEKPFPHLPTGRCTPTKWPK
ncbi:protein CutA homolog isoform X1 [Pelodiscus sinensis]|uniref:protein CutA homolog isoform X1 n=1 Tax=Pelodiscus sinensis TaxID=13735 RepID=UPI003F6CAAA0